MSQNTKGAQPTGRSPSLDFIRVMSTFFVITIHTAPRPLSWGGPFLVVFQMLLLTCNSNFYMLSGELNLKKNMESLEDYRNYYAGKAISILFPYMAMTCFLALWNMAMYGEEITCLSYMKRVYADFFVNNERNHLWFMYPLLGMLLSAPFLAKLLNRMEDFELHLMFAIGILWGIASIYLTQDLGVGFAYRGWLWDNWSLTFFAGYYGSRVIHGGNKKKWYALGVFCLVINILASLFLAECYRYSTDLAPAFVIFVTAAYSCLKNEIEINGEWAKRLLAFVAKHSFMMYMVHYHVSVAFTSRIVRATGSAARFWSSVAVTFFVSLAVAVLLDACFINPVQRWLRKRCFS